MATTVHKTHTEAGEQIASDDTWNGYNVLGQPYGVTYAFRATTSSYADSGHGEHATFSRFNEAQINAAQLALALWSDVTNISFTRVGSTSDPNSGATYSDNATILFGNYSSSTDGAGAFAYYPGSTSASNQAGDLWDNSIYPVNQAPTVGNYGFTTLLHELGHTLGLDHPGKYNADPGKTITYADNAEYVEDSRQYTVMSYFEASNTGADHSGGGPIIYGETPLVDDIEAAQLLYGVKVSTRTGDTVYGFHSNANRSVFQITAPTQKVVFAIWDAGGNDTMDFSGYTQNSIVDLRPGHFSSVGGLINNVAVAAEPINLPFGVDPNFYLIENAIGGVGNDNLIGNDANNRLFGGPGDDTLSGMGGNDILEGDDGTNTLNGGDGDDTAIFRYHRADYAKTVNPDGSLRFVGTGEAAGEVSVLRNIEHETFPAFTSTTKTFVPTSTALSLSGATALNDGSSDLIDVSTVFPEGLHFFGGVYSSLYVNVNGSISLGSAISPYSASAIGGNSNVPVIAPLWGDVDLNGSPTGKITYSADAAHATFTATWQNVGYFDGHSDKLNSFQVELVDAGSGDFDIVFRYQKIAWDDADPTGGIGTDAPARAGFSAGDGVPNHYYELPTDASGETLNLPNVIGNTYSPGVWIFHVSQGGVSGIGTDASETLTGDSKNNFIDGRGGDDIINAGAGNDVVFGGPGDDQIDGGPGYDTLRGGAGDDIYIVSDLLDTIVEAKGGGVDTVRASISYTLPSAVRTEVENLELTGTAQIGVGNELGNKITGTDFANILNGAAGDDMIDGRGGNDRIYGSYGNDVLIGGPGNDAYDGGPGFDQVVYQSPVDLDMLHPLNRSPDAIGDSFVSIELIVGSSGDDTLIGGAANEGFFGSAGADIIDGGAGNDVIEGGAGADQLSGGTGIDMLSYEHSPASHDTIGVVVTLLEAGSVTASGPDADGDTVLGGFESIRGSAFDDILTGNSIGNSLQGGSGDDLLIGLGGADRLDGGAGSDTVDYSAIVDARFGFTVVLGEGIAPATVSGLAAVGSARSDAAGDVLVNIENVVGGAGNDVIVGNSAVNELSGGGGNDRLLGLAGDDHLIGGNGDDILAGGAGADLLDGGIGINTADYSRSSIGVAASLLTGQGKFGDAEGDQLLSIQNLTGSSRNDTLTGDGSANKIDGGAGDDTIEGGDGADVLIGGLGINTASYEHSSAPVIVNLDPHASNNLTSGGDATGDVLSGFQNIVGSAFADILTGSSGANVIRGGGGEDTIHGGAGNDAIDGDDDNDTIDGGAGNDKLTGGGGADNFVFTSPSNGADTITDFVSGQDHIAIVRAGFHIPDTVAVGGMDANDFAAHYLVSVGTASAGPAVTESGHGQFIFNTVNGRLFWDDDGKAAHVPQLVAVLTEVHSLAASDFDLS